MRLLTTATDSEKLYDYNVVCPDLGFVLRLYIRVPVAA